MGRSGVQSSPSVLILWERGKNSMTDRPDREAKEVINTIEYYRRALGIDSTEGAQNIYFRAAVGGLIWSILYFSKILPEDPEFFWLISHTPIPIGSLFRPSFAHCRWCPSE